MSIFDIRFAGGEREIELEVVDVQPRDRHLLLLVRNGDEKSKFLCGHDERHWFVAAVPESARGVTGVASAKAALQPQAVRDLVERVRPKDPFRRRNEAFVRRDEPLTRGRGKPHVMQFAYRTGGEVVYVNARRTRGITEAQFQALPQQQRTNGGWQRLRRDAEVYAKGTVRHSDHATIELPTWHRVLMNTEQGARAMRHVAFLD